MQACMDRGGKVKNGQDMLELQAEAAWKIWNS
jgi:shikimate dehydrogenase